MFNPYKVWLLFLMMSGSAMADNPPVNAISEAEQMVVDFYQRVFVKRQNVEEAAQRYLHPDYIQHNPYVATGRKAFTTAIGGWLSQRPATHKMEIKRVISSGDYVVLHVHEYDTSSDKPGKAGVDIFRVSEGKIIEHWDVWQDIPKTMPHNNGML